ncbi:hypothetical protein ASE52_12025 [Acidovorax sp. Root275]|uniref:lysozyme inhibitor LprI family protein n=1 Tax=Acidovorax sp. Root275 TaxID=1736508 RepID=UPI00070BA49A|nr:lysozyme inhibitor LprI family protein [Acidovorax sp. Root275]KRD48113.1 hypothetical protein ASE52_12025 [Acidovorax sp. Root275]
MTRSTLWCALALLAPLASGALAAEHFCGQTTAHPIDKALAAAAERSGGVTVDLRDAQSAAYAAWDKELNRIYAQALKAAGPTRRDALRAAQRAWLAFDTAQGQWDAMLHADQGTSAALNIAGAALERRRTRMCDLSMDLQSLKDSE